jgi:DNA-binding SARP family transcriptional activator/predicted RNA-binding Zn ribbon-like protein
MDFRLLGSFEASVDGRAIAVGRRQERLLLAALLLDAGRVVPIDRLIGLFWDEPPRSARGAIHTYVGRLRQALQPHGVRLLTRGEGYLVEIDGHRIDAGMFTELAERAAENLDVLEQVRQLDEALALWRGPLLADLAGDAVRHRLGARLTELRLSSMELLAEARLAMGEHDVVVVNLVDVVPEYPTREHLVALLMTGLYRSHRQADAAELYRATRRLLVTDFGVEPGAELQELHVRILRNDPALDRPPAPVYSVRVRDQWLPWKTAGHPALEYCNTYAGWGGPPGDRNDWLRSYQVLAAWAGYLDLADDDTVSRLIDEAKREPIQANGVLTEARTLRSHLYACFTEPSPTAFGVVADYAEKAAKVSTFRRHPDGVGRWRISEDAGLWLPVYAAAHCAADLLADPRHFLISRCPGLHCGWLFLDPSGHRQWCSIALCAPEDRN